MLESLGTELVAAGEMVNWATDQLDQVKTLFIAAAGVLAVGVIVKVAFSTKMAAAAVLMTAGIAAVFLYVVANVNGDIKDKVERQIDIGMSVPGVPHAPDGWDGLS